MSSLDPKKPFKQAGVDIGKGKYHEEIVYGLALMYTVVYQEIGAYLKPHQLTTDDMNVLMLVKHQGQDKGLSQVDIGGRLMVTAHNITRQLQRLERSGFITRTGHQLDARVNMVKITAQGSDLLDSIWVGYDETVRGIASRLPYQEQMVLSGLLQKWLKNWHLTKQ